MGLNWNRKLFSVDADVYIITVFVVLILPLRLLLGFIAAIFFHELCHYIALRLTNANVYAVRLQATGITMGTAPLACRQELFCSLAGPFGSLLIVAGARYWPCAALFALGQSLFNLLPIFPLDGGRALRCILCRVQGKDRGLQTSRMVGLILSGCMILILCLIMIQLRLFLALAGTLFILLWKLILPKPLQCR